MDYHQNARLTVSLRAELAQRVVSEKLTFKAAGLLFHVSARTAAKWVRRSQQNELEPFAIAAPGRAAAIEQPLPL